MCGTNSRSDTDSTHSNRSTRQRGGERRRNDVHMATLQPSISQEVLQLSPPLNRMRERLSLLVQVHGLHVPQSMRLEGYNALVAEGNIGTLEANTLWCEQILVDAARRFNIDRPVVPEPRMLDRNWGAMNILQNLRNRVSYCEAYLNLHRSSFQDIERQARVDAASRGLILGGAGGDDDVPMYSR